MATVLGRQQDKVAKYQQEQKVQAVVVSRAHNIDDRDGYNIQDVQAWLYENDAHENGCPCQ